MSTERRGLRVIHKTFVCRQSHRTNDRSLINAAAETERNLHTTPLYIQGIDASDLHFATWRNVNPKKAESKEVINFGKLV